MSDAERDADTPKQQAWFRYLAAVKPPIEYRQWAQHGYDAGYAASEKAHAETRRRLEAAEQEAQHLMAEVGRVERDLAKVKALSSKRLVRIAEVEHDRERRETK